MRSARVTPNTVGYPSDYNALVNDAAGAASLLVHQMFGTIALPTNPTNTQTLTLDINGSNIVITFVSTIGTAAGNVLIGASAAATMANLIQLLLNPTISNSTQVAIGANTSANVTLINFVNWSPSGTNLVASSFNSTLYAPLSSFSASTTVTGGSYTANTMALYVEPGVVYVSGTRVIFAGSSSPTVTAPSSHPRIDVLTVDNTGTLAWTTGTENASPVAPTYPANKVALCELYNVVGETALYDNANQTSGQGYISNDVRPVIGTSVNLSAVQQDILPDADGTRNLGSGSFEWNNIYAKANIFVNGLATAVGRYGGTGADGALSVSSGTTTVSASNAGLLVKNYSSISITGTGYVQFTNPNTNGTIILLRVSGNVTLTSSSTPMLDASSMGGAGGAAVVSSTGNIGSSGYGYFLPTNPGQNTGAAGAAISAISLLNSTYSQYLTRYFGLFVAAGGGAGNALNSGASGGQGGNGGGCLIIEAVGTWNFTTTGGISVAGQNAGNGTGTGGQVAGGGGGGGGGFFLAFVGSITANTGTITVSGGVGGSNIGSPTASNCGGGGGSNTAGTASTSSGGGSGATGVSQVAVNSVFV